MTAPVNWFLGVIVAAGGLLVAVIALVALLYTVIADQLDDLATKEQLSALATKEQLEGLATKEQLEGLATKEQLEGLATKEQLEGLATKEQLEGLATEEQLKELDTRVAAAIGSVSWDPDTPILTSDSKTESDLLYFGPKPEGTWSVVLGQFAREHGVNVQQVDPSYSLLDYLRAQGASSIPDNLKTPLDLE